MKLLSDSGVDRYHSTDWDEKTKTAIPLEEKEQEAELQAFELDWGSWADVEMLSKADGKGTGTATDAKRPLPKDTKQVFDDKSIQTTASQKTLKGDLMEVDLENGVPSSKALEKQAQQEALEEEEREIQELEHLLMIKQRARISPQETAAKKEAEEDEKARKQVRFDRMVREQALLLQQAEANKLCNAAIGNLNFANNVEKNILDKIEEECAAEKARGEAMMVAATNNTGLIPPENATNMEVDLSGAMIEDKDGHLIPQELNLFVRTMSSDSLYDDALAASSSIVRARPATR